MQQKLGSKYCDDVVLKAEPIEKKEGKENKKLLNAELNDVRKKINNILKAVEKGFRNGALKERLDILKKREDKLVLGISKKGSVEFNYSYEGIKSFSKMIQNLIPHLEAGKL